MITLIFSVFDSKTAAYLPPFYMVTKPAALRAITDAVNDPQHVFHAHAEDYSLFYFGTLDDNAGKFELIEPPVHLAGLHELKSQDQS